MTIVQFSFVKGICLGLEYFEDEEDGSFNVVLNLALFRIMFMNYTIPPEGTV